MHALQKALPVRMINIQMCFSYVKRTVAPHIVFYRCLEFASETPYNPDPLDPKLSSAPSALYGVPISH